MTTRTDIMNRFAAAFAVTFAVAPVASPAQQATAVGGEVRRIDEAAGKITIKAGAMPDMGMDEGHTMVYRVQDPALLRSVKVGDKIKFDTDRSGGQFTVTRIEKVK